jgi:hypothetical protein
MNREYNRTGSEKSSRIPYRRALTTNIASVCGTTTSCNNGKLLQTDSNIAFI